MQHSEVLLTLAEVGIAFAGFTGLAALLARSRVDPKAHHARFRGMIENALIVVVSSILPLVLSPLGLPEAAAWRTASGVLAIVLVAEVAAAISRTLALESSSFSAALSLAIFGLLGLAICLLLTNAAGVFAGLAGAVYLVSLFAVLVVSAILFLRLLLAFVPGSSE